MRSRAGLAAVCLAAVSLSACGSGGSGGAQPAGASNRSSETGRAPSATTTVPAGYYRNPVYSDDFPDPGVIRVGATFHAFGTQGSGHNIQTLTSGDLVHWRPGADALPALPSWAEGGATWAPEVIAVGSAYVMFYVARDSELGTQCIGRAVSATPAGPYVDRSAGPFVCQPDAGGSIDPNPVRDRDGKLYLYWKNDGNSRNEPVHLWGQRMTGTATGLEGKPTALLTTSRSWQGTLIEAPEMVEHGDERVLLYSANDYASDKYAIGYATCTGPLGPCTDRSPEPLVRSTSDAAGPGHPAVVSLPGGSTWLLMHAWQPDAIGTTFPGRELWLEPLTWKGATPSVVPPTRQPQPEPRT